MGFACDNPAGSRAILLPQRGPLALRPILSNRLPFSAIQNPKNEILSCRLTLPDLRALVKGRPHLSYPGRFFLNTNALFPDASYNPFHQSIETRMVADEQRGLPRMVLDDPRASAWKSAGIRVPKDL